MARPALIIVRVENRDHNGGVGRKGHVLPGDVVHGVVAEVNAREGWKSVYGQAERRGRMHAQNLVARVIDRNDGDVVRSRASVGPSELDIRALKRNECAVRMDIEEERDGQQ